MSDFRSYQPPPKEPRFEKTRMIVVHFWPLALIFAAGLGALTIVAFPDLVNTPEPVSENTASRLATLPRERPTEPADAMLSLGNTSLWIDSEPVGAGVYVDGDSVGVTPVLVPVVDFGQRRVSVRASGYQQADTVMLIDNESPADLFVTLVRL